MEENSKKEILNNLEKLHDMVEDNDPNNQDQAVSEIMEEKVSDLYNELQENKFDIEGAEYLVFVSSRSLKMREKYTN